jgi:hypothetical protein
LLAVQAAFTEQVTGYLPAVISFQPASEETRNLSLPGMRHQNASVQMEIHANTAKVFHKDMSGENPGAARSREGSSAAPVTQ